MRIIDVFLGEHGVFYTQFDEIEAKLHKIDLAGLKEQAAILASALETHAHLEDELIFDVVSDVAVFEMMREEHGLIAGALMQVQQATDLERARALVRDAIATARDHFAEEERIAFPLIERSFTAEQLEELGVRWAEARGVRRP